MLKHSSGPEKISDEDGLYRTIHPLWIKDKGITSAAFKQRPPLDSRLVGRHSKANDPRKSSIKPSR